MTKNQKHLARIVATAILYGILLVVSHLVALPQPLELGLYVAVFLVISYDILWRACQNIRYGQLFDENFLMTIATIGAFFIGEYHDAVAVMLLYQIGELFQRYAVGKSRKDIAKLMDIRPEEATLLVDGQETIVHPLEVEIGQTIVVRAGERIPLDGIVQKGTCNLDTRSITGESLPQKVTEGQQVLSGCINLDGLLYVTTTSDYDNSTVGKVMQLVENASSQKAPAEKFISKFSKYYTPIVVVLALVLGVVPPIFDGQWAIWLKRAMMFLFVSCPCALVISVPMSFFGGIAAASKRGILVKGGNYLQLLCNVDTFAIDKTGTLTKGNFEVVDVVPQHNRQQILQTAIDAEQFSNHPIALSILKQGTPTTNQVVVTEQSGRGVVAQIGNDTILCGNGLLMSQHDVPFDVVEGASVVYVAKNGVCLGAIVVADEIKPQSKGAIENLKQMGCTAVMLTGDNSQTANIVAQKIGVDQVHSQLLPQHKVEKVQQLQKQGKKVAFVGDGINDAPVLVCSDVGIAMGEIGSDVAIESADIVLMYDDPSCIPTAKRIAQKTLGIVWQNIVFSLVVKFGVLALSAFGLIDSLIVAILADVGVCVVAILNAMRAMIVPKQK